MQTVTITALKSRFSVFIDGVRQGETILVLDRKVPVARLEPARPLVDDGDAATVSQLELRFWDSSAVLPFVSLDARLVAVAGREGFPVLN